MVVEILVKNTPHTPSRLFVGVRPRKHVGEGSNVRSETKIFNLDSDEFGSNLPLKKNGGSNIIVHFWREQLALKMNWQEMSHSFLWELELKKIQQKPGTLKKNP